MVNKSKYNIMNKGEIVEPIGLLLHLDKGLFEFPNPYCVEVEVLEDFIKTYKKEKKNNEKGTICIGVIKIKQGDKTKG